MDDAGNEQPIDADEQDTGGLGRRRFLGAAAATGWAIPTVQVLGQRGAGAQTVSPPPTTTTTTTRPDPEPPTTGLALWLRADDAVVDVTGTVVGWPDRSGNGRDAAPTGTPMLVPGSGGEPAVEFDGDSEYFTAPLDINPGVRPDLTVFAVWDTDSSSGSPLRKLYSHDNGGFDRTVGMDTRMSTEYGYFTGGGVGPIFNPAADTWYQTTDEWAGGVSFSAWVDGVLAVDDVAVGNGPGETVFRIGSNVPFSEDWDGSIAEMIVYETILPAVDRAAVEAYLRGRYGL